MADETSTSLFSSITSFFLPTAYAEAPEEVVEETVEEVEEVEEPESEAAAEEEEEEEDPEDQAPEIREDCEKNECKADAKHFQHCVDKVEGGQGWEGEDCVEELFHLMHCVDACAAPKLFKKLA